MRGAIPPVPSIGVVMAAVPTTGAGARPVCRGGTVRLHNNLV